MIGSSHSQLCKKYSCSVKLQFGTFDHSPREMDLEDRTLHEIESSIESTTKTKTE